MFFFGKAQRMTVDNDTDVFFFSPGGLVGLVDVRSVSIVFDPFAEGGSVPFSGRTNPNKVDQEVEREGDLVRVVVSAENFFSRFEGRLSLAISMKKEGGKLSFDILKSPKRS